MRTLPLRSASILLLSLFAAAVPGACGGNTQLESSGTSNGGNGGNGGNPNGSTCGTQTCAEDEYCNDSSGLCGKGPAEALSCQKKSTGTSACGDGGTWVCGCDGIAATTDCIGAVSVDGDASHCAPPTPQAFACGSVYCNLDQGPSPQFCQEIKHPDDPTNPTQYSCQPLTGCGTPVTCDCLPNCGSGSQPPMCTIDAAGNATQHCFTG